ncbi:efflux RND transporter periplasmic adaptor subunit [Propionivibrio limicola]|uniref:efflux RND transporter periplasmic adaptor subunit n=1 Tax=Propionivibrio limicola TaxID=167645 RepID=UPI001292390B|nr:efflux RND transporter periplasmic adaptor subunit [Propionivibrio limicola]
MKQGQALGIGLVTVALATGGGYWFGSRTSAPGNTTISSAGSDDSGVKKERKLLYYRNPMGLPDTSPTPKKDPMGMNYIPVYEGEDTGESDAAGTITVSTEKVQKLGVRTEAAQRRVLDRIVRAAGRVEPDERRLYAIAPKFEGYVERLHVNVTGQPVGKGQPLFEVYSPELVSAQREYAIAAQGVDALKGAGGEAQDGMRQLAESSLLRLKNWDIPEAQVKAMAKSGQTRRTLTFHSPVAGIVTEKKALQGMRFMPGEMLYQVADLSSVWVVADVFEQDIGLLKPGAKATVRINAYPDKIFEGKVSYVYPTLNPDTRTVPVRVELANPGLLLKPAMFAQVELPVAAQKNGMANVVTVPVSAIIDSGKRQIALVQLGKDEKAGRFEPREVKLGARSDNYVEVIEGIKEGEQVVVAANFLIDAESNLKAAVGGFGAAPTEGAGKLAATVGHQASGTIESVDAATGMVSIEHGPVASLKWPAMTMEFKPANAALMKGLQPGAAIDFEFVERGQGEWVITGIKPANHKQH